MHIQFSFPNGTLTRASEQDSFILYSKSLKKIAGRNINILICMLNTSPSVQFSHAVVSDSLRPHRLQHARPPYPSLTPEVYSNSCPLNGDAIQPSQTLSSPSPPILNLSQHQGLFKWDSSSHQVAKVLEFQLQHQFFQWIFRTNFL